MQLTNIYYIFIISVTKSGCSSVGLVQTQTKAADQEKNLPISQRNNMESSGEEQEEETHR